LGQQADGWNGRDGFEESSTIHAFGLCHTVLMLTALLLLALTLPASVQEKSTGEIKPPKRGDLVVVKGCVANATIDSNEVTGSEKESRYFEFVTFRLTGDKKVLDEVRKEHAGHSDVLHGELRSDLPKPGQAGKLVGNSRVSIGVGRGMQPEPSPPLPVLKVTSIDHTGITCR